MRRYLGVLFLAASVNATAQVVLTANAPQYNFQVLAGSQRQISVSLTGGTTKKVNWSVVSSTGGASATLDHGANAIGVTNVTIGPAQGACSIHGTPGNYTVTSPQTVTVQAQSVDDQSKTAKFLFNVCANTTSVDVVPAYQQAYRGQQVEIQTWVTGNTNEAGTWSMVSAPAGGDATYPDLNRRDLLFSATVPGRYVMKYTSAADPTKSILATVYVSPHAMPSYTTTTSLTQPTECYADPALAGKVYEVGPGLAYTTIRSVPTNSWPAGSIMRIHNVDTTGSNPTTYHEATRIMGTGTPSQPVIVCGVPDASGNMPVIDGVNALSPPWANPTTQLYGIMSIWGSGPYNSPYINGSAGPDYVILSGLAIAHAGVNYNVTSLATNAPTPYADGASCVNVRSGTHLLIEGNDMNFCSNGLFVANNAQNVGFSQVTRYVDVRGNRIRNSGETVGNVYGTHDAYVQSWYSLIEGNRFENLVDGSAGDALKERGIESIIRYNLFKAQVANQLINFQSETDSEGYLVFEPYLGAAGATTCQAVYCGSDNTLDPDHLTAFQEHLEKDYVYGNIFSARSTGLADIQYGDTGGQNAPYANASEMADHQGRLYFYNNTDDQPGLSVFATLSGFNNGSTPEQQFMKPTVIAMNNILYKTKQNPNIFAFARNASVVGVWQTNLMNAGTFAIPAPNPGLPSTQITAVNGWDNYTDPLQYPLDTPIDTHQTGYTAANFLATPATNLQPYNPVTFAPVAGAGATGAGTAITDPWASLLPVRLQYSVDTNSVIPRTSATTIGAVDTGTQPTLMSIAPTGRTLAMLTTLRSPWYTPTPLSLVCTYSNGLTTDCGPSVTMTASTPAVTVLGANQMEPTSTGAGILTATLNGVVSAPMLYSVNGAPITQPVTPVITAVALSPGAGALVAGATLQLGAVAIYSDGSTRVCTPSSWTSTAPAAATVNNSGLVSAIAAGASNVAAVCSSIQSAPSVITVTAVPVTPPAAPTITAVALSPSSATMVAGAAQQLNALAIYSNAKTQVCTPTAWNSSAPSIATVSSSGVVTGAAAGISSVTAVCGGVRSAVSVMTITAAPPKAPTLTAVTLSPAVETMVAGDTQQLVATAVYSDGTTQSCTPTAWSSSAPGIVTVSSSGLVSGAAAGISSVTGVCSNTRSSVSVITITPKPPTITAVTLTPAAGAMVIGNTQQLLATATYSDASTQACVPASWSSSAPGIATVSSSGVVTGVAAGTSNVTAVCGGVTSSQSALTIAAARVKAWTMRPVTTP